jgi:hypothetical protein
VQIHKQFPKVIIFLFVLSLVGCTLPIPNVTGDEDTSTPTPPVLVGPASPSSKTGLADYKASPIPICSIAKFSTISLFDYQGNLSAWSPDGTELAFIRPNATLTWFIGDLVIASGSKFNQLKVVAPNAAGRVYWSPDGKSLAFVSLRQDDKVYTIMVVNRDGSGLLDLFPDRSAKTDDYSARKTILSWPDANHIHVMISCGSSCTKALEISLPGGESADFKPSEDEVRNAWSILRSVKTVDAKSYPIMNEPNWSLKDRYIVFLDEKSYMWVLDQQQKTIHPVYMENMFPVYPSQPWARETNWSVKDQLAVRVDDHLEIFNPACSKAIDVTNP